MLGRGDSRARGLSIAGNVQLPPLLLLLYRTCISYGEVDRAARPSGGSMGPWQKGGDTEQITGIDEI